MTDENTRSPAVASLKDEQTYQQEHKEELDQGLEDTFPASDPVAMTSSSTAGGAGETYGEVPAEKVDDALAAVRSRTPGGSDVLALEELQAMKAEISRMTRSAGEIRTASGRIAKTGATTVRKDVERRIRSRPLAAVGLAALAGYVWGTVR
jgi:hypothetical protein